MGTIAEWLYYRVWRRWRYDSSELRRTDQFQYLGPDTILIGSLTMEGSLEVELMEAEYSTVRHFRKAGGSRAPARSLRIEIPARALPALKHWFSGIDGNVSWVHPEKLIIPPQEETAEGASLPAPIQLNSRRVPSPEDVE